MSERRVGSFLLSALLALSCGDDAGPPAEAGAHRDAAQDAQGEPQKEAGAALCGEDADCSDGLFCNGEERCERGQCESGQAVVCDDGVACTFDECGERTQSCTSAPPDADGDGHFAVDCADGQGNALGDDCDDQDALRFPGNLELCDAADHDEDCDPETFGEKDSDGDGFFDRECCNGDRCGKDCQDLRANVHPEATEACDLLDNNCDGVVDEGVKVDLYADADHDLHGKQGAPAMVGCPGTAGYVTNHDDCDDADPERYAGLLEFCDGKDNDCDGTPDDSPQDVPWYLDADDDGFGDPGSAPLVSCTPVTDRVINARDCDDADNARSPATPEECDGLDNDCDPLTSFALDTNDFEDDDGDLRPDVQCGQGADDCDDQDATTAIGAEEVCDGRDNNCDGAIDENVVSTIWFLDRDGDGYGDESGSQQAFCGLLPGYVSRGGDCADDDAARRPGAIETCNNLDDNCDHQTDEGVVADAQCQPGGDKALPHAYGYCFRGACKLEECVDGYLSCDGKQSNGCETAGTACPSSGSVGGSGGAGASGSGGAGGTGGSGGSGGGPSDVPIDCTGTITPGDVTITDAAELTAFAASGVTCIGGSLTVSSSSLVDLQGLAALQWVSGDVNIWGNAELQSLQGLAGLTTIGQHLYIQSNPKLTSLGALSSLTTLGGSLGLYNLPLLQNLSGFLSLTRVFGSLDLTYLPVLTHLPLSAFPALSRVDGTLTISNNGLFDLDGFGQLDQIGGSLSITDNALLTGVAGFASLTTVGADLLLTRDPALLQVSGFLSLTDVGRFLSLGDDDQLVSVTGLSSLDHVGQELRVYRNPVLTALDGLIAASIAQIDGALAVTTNPQLSACQVTALAASIGTLGANTSCCNEGCGSCNGAQCNAGSSGGTAGQNGTYIGNVAIYGPADFALIGTASVIDGNLDIYSSGVVNLTALSNLTEVTGTLSIYANTDLTRLTGLEQLTKAGALSISSNGALQDLAGLSSLQAVDGALDIYSNGALASLDAFPALTTVGGALTVQYNDALTSLSGFGALTSVTGSLGIWNNAALDTLGGLPLLSLVGGAVEVRDNAALAHLSGLGGLTQITGDLLVLGNDSLLDVTGLSSLQEIVGDLHLEQNPELATATGLHAALSLLGGECLVARNPKLSRCEVDQLLAQVGITKDGLGDLTTSNGGCAACAQTLPSWTCTDGVPVNAGQSTAYPRTLPAQPLTVYAYDAADLASFASVDTLNASLGVNSSDVVSLNGLGALQAVNGSLNIYGNSSLGNLNALSSLLTVTGNLDIGGNGTLSNVNGLTALTSVGGDLSLYSCAITNIDALLAPVGALATVGGNVYIAGNWSMSDCAVAPLQAQLQGSTGTFTNSNVQCATSCAGKVCAP